MPDQNISEFDLHGHTYYSAWWEAVNYTPEDAIKRARDVGLDGIAITGHDTVQGLDEALDIAAREGLILVPGLEITSRIGGRLPHILALGIEPDTVIKSKYKIPSFQQPDVVISWIHDHGGIAIGEHPFEKGHFLALSYEEIQKLSNKLDAIEVATTRGLPQRLKDIAIQSKIAQLGSSDFHMMLQIGLVRSKITGDKKPTTWQEVVKAIQQNQTTAYIPNEIPRELMGRGNLDMILRQLKGEKL